ncbi:CHCH domain protein, putative [Babesia caballi]|uniref:CHCH domain protein, putative n=1 Tax=Babesia caballi TaxID=5871 RepID=A0AAV4LRP9_BABCB|nr:CHCH domain protein, putative [Babesia caballi]
MAEQPPPPPLYARIAHQIRQAHGDVPMSYLEFREADYKLAKERQEVVKIIGARVRDLCRYASNVRDSPAPRAELDDYVNCYGEKTYAMFSCRREADSVKRCVRHYQEELGTPASQQRIMEERLRSGESFVVPSFLKNPSGYHPPYTRAGTSPQSCSGS